MKATIYDVDLRRVIEKDFEIDLVPDQEKLEYKGDQYNIIQVEYGDFGNPIVYIALKGELIVKE